MTMFFYVNQKKLCVTTVKTMSNYETFPLLILLGCYVGLCVERVLIIFQCQEIIIEFQCKNYCGLSHYLNFYPK